MSQLPLSDISQLVHLQGRALSDVLIGARHRSAALLDPQPIHLPHTQPTCPAASQIGPGPLSPAGDGAGGDHESIPGTPASRVSMGSSAFGGAGERPGSRGRSAPRVSGTMTAWFDRLNQSFSQADRVLHQDLAGAVRAGGCVFVFLCVCGGWGGGG